MKYSYQRELILNIVKNSKLHPTAYMVYNEAKKIKPDISLGTVYRNLASLKSNDIIKYIPLPNTDNRYDGNITSHSHFHCIKCNKIYDISNDSMISLFNEISSLGHELITHDLVFEGICHDCRREK